MKTFKILLVAACILSLGQAACTSQSTVDAFRDAVGTVNACRHKCIDKGHTFCFDPKDIEDATKHACYTNGTQKLACTNDVLCTSTDLQVPMGFKYSFCGIKDATKKAACGSRNLVFKKTNETTTTTTKKVAFKVGDLCSYTIKMPDDSRSGDYMHLIIKQLKNVKMSMHQYRDIGANGNILPSQLTFNDIWPKSEAYTNYKSNFFKLESNKQIDDDDKEIKYKFKPGYSKVAYLSFSSENADGSFEFDIVTNFRKNNKPKKAEDEGNDTVYIVMLVLLVILFYILGLFIYQWKFGKKKQQEEYEHRRSLYKQENENIRKSISRRSIRESLTKDPSFKSRAADPNTALRVEHIGTVKTGPSVNEFPVTDKQVNGHSNGETEYKTNGLEKNNDNGTNYQPLNVQNQGSVEMSMVKSGIQGESRQLLIGGQEYDDGLSVPVSPQAARQQEKQETIQPQPIIEEPTVQIENQENEKMQFDHQEIQNQEVDLEIQIPDPQAEIVGDIQNEAANLNNQSAMPNQQESEISMSMEDMSEDNEPDNRTMGVSNMDKNAKKFDLAK